MTSQMTPQEKCNEKTKIIEEHAKVAEEKAQKFGCDTCRFSNYTHHAFQGYRTPEYRICCCLPYWCRPIAIINKCPKKSFIRSTK